MSSKGASWHVVDRESTDERRSGVFPRGVIISHHADRCQGCERSMWQHVVDESARLNAEHPRPWWRRKRFYAWSFIPDIYIGSSSGGLFGGYDCTRPPDWAEKMGGAVDRILKRIERDVATHTAAQADPDCPCTGGKLSPYCEKHRPDVFWVDK